MVCYHQNLELMAFGPTMAIASLSDLEKEKLALAASLLPPSL